ncbi:MAG TPA: hypothetical protein VF533_00480 [Solirubrobacteraceae bacterium]
MATRTPSRTRPTAPATGAQRRFSRPSAPPARASRIPSFTPPGRRKAAPTRGAALAGLLGGGGGKAKPALALLAAGAGAILGRKQVQKRQAAQAPAPQPAPPVFTAPVDVPGAETPLRTPNSTMPPAA